MDKNALKSIMVRNGDTQSELAAGIGISLSRLNAKINGTGGASFKQAEIARIKKRYSLQPEVVDRIFFEDNASY